MATEERQSSASVADRLHEEFYRFSFFKAVELLESLAPEKKKLGQALVPGDEPVRFSVNTELAFPPSEISALELNDEFTNLEVTFLGMVGPSGVLPYWYTELIQDRQRDGDKGFKEFLDLFHHRLISLFYLAWKKNKFTANYQQGAKDKLSSYLLSLIGLGTSKLSERIGLPVDSLAFYSGHLARNSSSALSIETVVAHFSGVNANVEQFIERVLPLELEDQVALGVANRMLGDNTVIGSEIHDCQTKFRVVLGPLTYKELIRFLPCGQMLAPMFSLVKYMVGIEYEFEMRLILNKNEIPPLVIGAPASGAPQLGWSTWAKDPDFALTDDPYITFSEAELDVN